MSERSVEVVEVLRGGGERGRALAARSQGHCNMRVSVTAVELCLELSLDKMEVFSASLANVDSFV